MRCIRFERVSGEAGSSRTERRGYKIKRTWSCGFLLVEANRRMKRKPAPEASDAPSTEVGGKKICNRKILIVDALSEECCKPSPSLSQSFELLSSRVTGNNRKGPKNDNPNSKSSLPSTAMSSRQVNWTAHNLLQRPNAPIPASPQAAARAAAEARNRNLSLESVVDRMERLDLFCPLAEEKRPFHRLLDDQVSSRSSIFALSQTINDSSVHSCSQRPQSSRPSRRSRISPSSSRMR